MWKTIHAIREGKCHAALSQFIAICRLRIVRLTWKDKEEVPAVAAPRLKVDRFLSGLIR